MNLPRILLYNIVEILCPFCASPPVADEGTTYKQKLYITHLRLFILLCARRPRAPLDIL